jgi:TPP-dependent pyruvate/acetoin dehydrogenase alpha subunit
LIVHHLAPEQRLEMYATMRRMRAIEEMATALYHQGRTVGRVYTGRGQEAISVGSAYALRKEDAVVPLHRDLGAHLIRGITARELFCQYLGRANSSTQGKDAGLHISNPDLGLMVNMISNLPATLPVAVGVALAFKIRKEPRIMLTYFGEGASSTGASHEGINFASVRRLPIVFICENNQWALSTPTNKQYAVEHLADRAIGYGIPGAQVDGNDVLAVYEATKTAAARAREGSGPTLIEAMTMRMHGHSVTDPAQYVPEAMLEHWQEKDPIVRFASILRDQGVLTAQLESDIEEQIAHEIEDAVDFAENSPSLPPEEAVKGVYSAPRPEDA